MELQEIREQLDQVDQEIVELFEKRMELCIEVGKNKRETGKKIYDQERERKKLDTLSQMVSNDFNKAAVKELFEHIMEISRKLQKETFPELEE